MAGPIYIPTISVQESTFVTFSSPKFVICRLPDTSQARGDNLIEILICVSLLISDIEHLFICILAICMSSLGKGHSSILPIFLPGLYFFMLSCISCLYILDINPISVLPFTDILPSIDILFVLSFVSFAVQKKILS